VQFINDSKATNIQSVWYALSAFHQPVILLLGGRDKGNNWRELFPQLQNKVHTIIAFGEAREKIAYELEFMVPNLIQAKDLVEGVHLAREQAKAGEIVLLSPACASFDQYKNYEERGQHFKQLVGSLSERIDQQEGQI
jgi:UDP-N-acetylmuramoylalanine--D-glutamate ligase